MKKVLLTSLIFLSSLFLFNQKAFSINELFRSRVSGNWNANSSWEMSTNGGTIWFNATSTPNSTSDAITIRSPNTIMVTANVNVDQLSVFGGSTISINGGNILTIIDGTGNDLILMGTISGSGTLQTQGISTIIQIVIGSTFNVPLNVSSGVTAVSQTASPFTAVFRGSILIDPGATLNSNAPTIIQANSVVINNGLISGNSLRIRGPALLNNGSITATSLLLDSTISLSGTGTFLSSNVSVGSTGNVSLGDNLTFSPMGFVVNSGGIFNPNGRTFTINSGIFTLNTTATISNSGIFQTQSLVTMNIHNGSSFLAPLKVNTGTTSVYDSGSPFTATFIGAITIDAGATLQIVSGAYFLRANGNLTNNGTISGVGSGLKYSGSTFTNNGIVSPATVSFEIGSHLLQGTGSIDAFVNILGMGTVTLGSNHQLRGASINSGGSLNLSTFKILVTASNPILNSGNFVTTNGTVEYNGSSFQNISTSNISYRKLRINNPSGTLLLGNATVTDTLSLILGDLDLNGNILTISSTGYLSESAGNTVYGNSGSVTTTRSLNAPSFLNVGGLGAVINSTANLGSTVITRSHIVQTGLSVDTSIKRYFDITPTNNSSLNATLLFKYDDSELNGCTEGSLILFRSTNSGTNWTPAGGSVNSFNNEITLTGINSFSRWTASDNVSALNPTYKLTAKNISFQSLSFPNDAVDFEIYLENTTTTSIVFEYSLGQYYFDFNSSIANANSELTYSILGSDLPVNMRPRNPTVGLPANPEQNILCLAFNTAPGCGSGVVLSPGSSTKIVKMRLRRTGASFNSQSLNLVWRNGTANPYTKIFSYLTGCANTEITTPAAHFIDVGKILSLRLGIQGFWNGSTQVADTVVCYLRSSVSPFQKIDSAKQVVNHSAQNFTFFNAPAGTYYLHIKHRNTIETWSGSGGLAFGSGSVSYDFTTSLSQAYGNNMINKLSRFCFFGGDINQDGLVNLNDILLVYNDAVSFSTGYIKTDVTGDNITNLNDILITANNSASFVVKITP